MLASPQVLVRGVFNCRRQHSTSVSSWLAGAGGSWQGVGVGRRETRGEDERDGWGGGKGSAVWLYSVRNVLGKRQCIEKVYEARKVGNSSTDM